MGSGIVLINMSQFYTKLILKINLIKFLLQYFSNKIYNEKVAFRDGLNKSIVKIHSNFSYKKSNGYNL